MSKITKIAIIILLVGVLVVPFARSYASSKCAINCTNPNAPSYDVWGNGFDAQGNLINLSNEKVDPISHIKNPYYLLWQADHGDLNHDGKVNLNDISILLSNYGKNY